MNEEKNKRMIVIPGEKIKSGEQFLPGEGTRREGDDIVAIRYGLAEESEKLVKVIPLSGVYIPRRGNVIIGIVEDVTFNGWIVNINSPLMAFLSASDLYRVNKNNLEEHFQIGDLIVCKIFGVKKGGVDLTIKGRGFGKIEEGRIIRINQSKVPRVIGKEGNMVNLIKQETDSDIIVGQNGLILVKADEKGFEKAKKAIEMISEKSYIDGLTDKVKEFLEKKE